MYKWPYLCRLVLSLDPVVFASALCCPAGALSKLAGMVCATDVAAMIDVEQVLLYRLALSSCHSLPHFCRVCCVPKPPG